MRPEEWRRLSTRMLLIHPVQELLRAWPLLAGLVFAGAAGESWWSLAGAGLVAGTGVFRWFTTTYRVTTEQVQVRHGLLRRQVLTVPRDRVRTVDVTAHALHRFLGLARVEVGTGRSDRKDEGVRLDALDAAAAATLRDELLHRAAPAVERGAADETVLAEVPLSWVRYGPFTLTGVVAVGIVAGVAGRLINEARLDPGRLGVLSTLLEDWERAPLAAAVAAVVAVLAVAVVIFSTFGYVLAFYGFRLTRSGAGTLHVTRGLITTRATTIEERRLRGVELSEPLLLRAAGGARCIAITTGLRVGRGAERGGSLLLPPGPREEARRVAVHVLRDSVPLDRPLVRHGRRATWRRFSRAAGLAVLAVAACLALWGVGVLPAWTWQASLTLPPIAALLAYDRARNLGHAVSDASTLVARQGSVVRRRAILSCDGIIGWNLRSSFFQRRAGLVTLVATTAAGHQAVEVLDVPVGEALRIAEEALPGMLSPFLEGPPRPGR
jgi:putative membrane protein